MSFEDDCLKLKALYLLIKDPQSKNRGLEIPFFVVFCLQKITRVLGEYVTWRLLPIMKFDNDNLSRGSPDIGFPDISFDDECLNLKAS